MNPPALHETIRSTSVLACLLSLAACAGEASPSDSAPSYYEDVAPVLNQRCASCHAPGQIAPFPLLTYEDARPLASAIKAATQSRTMPPFNVDASGDCHSYADARWLSDEELDTLAAWADAGAPEGDPASAPPPPAAPAHLDAVTHQLDIGAEYTPSGQGTDHYRCFLVDPETTADAFLTAYEVKPGDPRVVHHVILFGLNGESAEKQAAALDEAEDGPGYTCFGGPQLDGGFSFLAGWAPGTGATFYPEGTGIRLVAGRKAVLQVHYNLSAGAFADRTTIDLHLEPSVQTAAHVLPLANLGLSLPPGQASVSQSFETALPGAATFHLLGVFPHMHLLGTSLEVARIRGDEESCVTRVPRWNFHWQEFFFYETPVDMASGDIARITCSYDTRGMKSTVTWGEGTSDEMCLAGFYVTRD